MNDSESQKPTLEPLRLLRKKNLLRKYCDRCSMRKKTVVRDQSRWKKWLIIEDLCLRCLAITLNL